MADLRDLREDQRELRMDKRKAVEAEENRKRRAVEAEENRKRRAVEAEENCKRRAVEAEENRKRRAVEATENRELKKMELAGERQLRADERAADYADKDRREKSKNQERREERAHDLSMMQMQLEISKNLQEVRAHTVTSSVGLVVVSFARVFFLVASGELAVLHRRACTRGGGSTAYLFPVFMSVAFFFSSSQR